MRKRKQYVVLKGNIGGRTRANEKKSVVDGEIEF